jgi:hypothetical protein
LLDLIIAAVFVLMIVAPAAVASLQRPDSGDDGEG